MSITPSVHTPRVLLVALCLVGPVALLSSTPSATASLAATPSANPRVPAPDVDPAVRLASLQALLRTRSADAANSAARRDGIQRRLAETQTLAEAARARTDALSRKAEAAAARADRAQANVNQLAAAAYRSGSDGNAVVRMFSSKSIAELSYRHEIVKRVGDVQQRTIRVAKREHVRAEAAAEEARQARNRVLQEAGALTAQVQSSAADAARSQAAADRIRFWTARWQAIATGVATTIMGPTLVTPEELAAWFAGTRRHARTTVPIEELTRDYVEEGTAAGVRGDIAFAQSILETGSFFFPDSGMVRTTDNNFAGIGACDSCSSGRGYPDARTGVRAQMQLLRVYADPKLTNAQLHPPAVDPKLDRHFLKGKVPTWGGLTHTWATANAYGDRILRLYEQILAWNMDRASL